MGKGLQNVFKTVVKDILQEFPPLGESGSEASNFIPEPRNFVCQIIFYVLFTFYSSYVFHNSIREMNAILKSFCM